MRYQYAVAFAACLATTPASAQSPCIERATLIERITGVFGESRISISQSKGFVFETFANLESGTWTTFVTRPSGISCIAAAGDSFELTKGDIAPIKGFEL